MFTSALQMRSEAEQLKFWNGVANDLSAMGEDFEGEVPSKKAASDTGDSNHIGRSRAVSNLGSAFLALGCCTIVGGALCVLLKMHSPGGVSSGGAYK
ncbi:MAG: hypothetical protein FRX49_06874 [Trebouxia sp. A1-2]|nr:MAG: hypothetical protein FRX49_06874 [Trebouxia sp. A1-2]